MQEWTLDLIIAAISFVIFAVLAIYVLIGSLRDSVVFRPTRNNVTDTTEPHTDMYVGDVMTRWFQNGHQDILFYLHGNSGSISDRDYVVEFAKLAGIDLVLIDYRGYGASRGTPSVTNMREDAAEVMDVIQRKYKPENIIVMSESLGSIAASYIASKYKVRGVVIMAGISSFSTIAKNIKTSNIMKKLASVALGDLDSVTNSSLLAHAKSPVLIVHSETDEIVPHACAVENRGVCPKAAEIVKIEGGHSTPRISQDNLADILKFMHIPVGNLDRYNNWLKMMEMIGETNRFRVVDM